MFRKKAKQSSLPVVSQPKPISAKTDFPSGLAVRTDKAVYLIKGKTRFRFFSERCFASWKMEPIPIEFSAIKHFLSGGSLGFRDGTLINNVANGRIYLVSGSKKCHITSPDVFTRYGLDPLNTLLVSDEEAAIHKDGEVLK